MASMSFLVNDQTTDTTPQPKIRVTLEENGSGGILMTVAVEGTLKADLRGLFFDVADESLLKSLSIKTTNAKDARNNTEFRQGDDSVRDLGDGANMNGLLGSDNGFDAGVEIGTSGIGKDDVDSFSFVLSSTTRGLSLADFANVDFGVRSTSVGAAGSSRSASSKLLEKGMSVLDAANDSDSIDENESHTGNVLTNDRTGLPQGDVLSVTGWTGGALGQAVTLANTEGATLTMNADGSYSLDASASDALSKGESFTFTFTYDSRNDHGGTDWSTDSATLTVTVKGVNDGPEAEDDDAGAIDEDATAQGNVLGNDSDIDRNDTLQVTGVLDKNGNYALGTIDLASGAQVTLNADGSYTYDPHHAFDSLYSDEHADDSFDYQISDGNGGYDSATVTVRINGKGQRPSDDPGDGNSDGDDDPPAPPPVDDFPLMLQALSNVVLYLDDGNTGTGLMKVKISPAANLKIYDVDDLLLAQFFSAKHDALAGNTTLVGISIHAGQEYPNDKKWDGTREGEGVFFLMDDDTPIAPVGVRDAKGGWTKTWTVDDVPLSAEAAALGLTATLLGAAADQSYTFTGSW